MWGYSVSVSGVTVGLGKSTDQNDWKVTDCEIKNLVCVIMRSVVTVTAFCSCQVVSSAEKKVTCLGNALKVAAGAVVCIVDCHVIMLIMSFAVGCECI